MMLKSSFMRYVFDRIPDDIVAPDTVSVEEHPRGTGNHGLGQVPRLFVVSSRDMLVLPSGMLYTKMEAEGLGDPGAYFHSWDPAEGARFQPVGLELAVADQSAEEGGTEGLVARAAIFSWQLQNS